MESNQEEYKKYSDLKNNNIEYANLIQNNPQEIFSNISKERITLWETKLYSSNSPTFIEDESLIINTIPNHENQKIIKNDALRTRVREAPLVPAFKKLLEQIITFYCKKNDIKYKQGLNEIFGPLILLQYKIKPFSLIKVYNIAECLIKRYMPNYFFEVKFFSLYSSLNLFTLLLKYHAPEVYNVLDNLMITPEMYATGWIMTMLTSKCRLDVTYQLWDHLIRIDDQLFFHFIMVALLKSKQNLIINTDRTLIPSLMSNLSIFSVDEMDDIIQKSLEMRNNTPYSFRILANKLEVFKFGSTKLQEKYEYYKPETMSVMPMFPSEVFYITYKSIINCPDEDCDVLKNVRKEITDSKGKENHHKKDSTLTLSENDIHKCEHCTMKIFKRIPFILLDLRILEYGTFEDEDEKTGFLPKMIMIPQNELKLDDFPEMITERFIPDKGNFHFVFLTSGTDYFKDYENFYSEKISERDKKKMMFDIQTKVNKELDLQKAEQKISQKEFFKLKEYDNLKLTLISLLKQNFPYISYVYGGFNEVHNECDLYDISLLNHEETECILCKMKKKSEKSMKKKNKSIFGKIKHLFDKKSDKANNDSNDKHKEEPYTHERLNTFQSNTQKIANDLWKHKIKIKYSEITKIIQNPNNYVTGCIYKDKSSESLEEKNKQLILCLLSEQNEIQLYQPEKNKFYEVGKPQITNIKNKAVVVNPTENKKELELCLVEKISILDIKTVKRKPKMKNIVMIEYVKNPIEEMENNPIQDSTFTIINYNNTNQRMECSLVLDLTSENESKRLINTIKKYNEEYLKKK